MPTTRGRTVVHKYCKQTEHIFLDVISLDFRHVHFGFEFNPLVVFGKATVRRLYISLELDENDVVEIIDRRLLARIDRAKWSLDELLHFFDFSELLF